MVLFGLAFNLFVFARYYTTVSVFTDILPYMFMQTPSCEKNLLFELKRYFAGLC